MRPSRPLLVKDVWEDPNALPKPVPLACTMIKPIRTAEISI